MFRYRDGFKKYTIFAIIGFVVYINRIIYELPNPDTVWGGLVWKESWEWESKLGRYMIRFWQLLVGYTINPALITISCIMILAIVCILVIDIMDIKNEKLQIVAGLLIIVSPAVGCTLSYYYCSYMYMLAYLLSVLGIWIVVKKDNAWWYIFASLCVMISLATYQAYLPVAVVLAGIYISKSILSNDLNFKTLTRKMIIFVIMGISGIIFYLLGFKVMQKMWNVSAATSRGFSQMGYIDIRNLKGYIKECYESFYEYYFKNSMINNGYGFRKEINLIFAIVVLLLAVYIIKRNEINKKNKLIFAILCILSPVAFVSIHIMAPEVSLYETTGSIMLPTMSYVYVFFVVILDCFFENESRLQHLVKCVSVVSICLVVYMLFIIEYQGQVYQKKCMDKTYAVANNIVQQIRDMDKDTICIIGSMENGNYPEQYQELKDNLGWLTTSYGMIWPDYNGTQGCWKYFISAYMGKDYNTCSYDDYKVILETEEYSDLTNFPNENSVKVINDVIVIKLSD